MGSLKLERQTIVDLLVTALEGGSNYWYIITYLPDVLREGLDTEAKIEYLLDNPVTYVNLYDLEDMDLLGELKADTIKKGVQALKRSEPKHYLDAFNDEWDADTADVFLQLTIMGEIVFG